jgi:hypothetical protein
MIKEKIVKWEMKEALEEKELITISLDAKDVLWENEGKECRINGRLFDVKEFENINGKCRLKGLYDEREKEIEEQLAHMTKNNKNQQETLIGKWLKFSYVEQDIFTLSIKPFSLPRTKKPRISENIYHSPCLSVISPPPEVI